VKASEEEGLRRVQEKKKTARRDDSSRDSSRDVKNAVRTARQRVSDLEGQIQLLETRIEALTAQLEDPELYTKPSGVSRAKELGTDLDRMKGDLERALDQWGNATETLDTLASEAP
jgi:predicted  nucleic acid-binding Zn-ribbon protein